MWRITFLIKSAQWPAQNSLAGIEKVISALLKYYGLIANILIQKKSM